MMGSFQELCYDHRKSYWFLAMDKSERDGVKFLIVQSCNTSPGTLRPSDGTGMPQIYHFVCPPQPQFWAKNKN